MIQQEKCFFMKKYLNINEREHSRMKENKNVQLK